jgi:hypothetical protein
MALKNILSGTHSCRHRALSVGGFCHKHRCASKRTTVHLWLDDGPAARANLPANASGLGVNDILIGDDVAPRQLRAPPGAPRAARP